LHKHLFNLKICMSIYRCFLYSYIEFFFMVEYACISRCWSA